MAEAYQGVLVKDREGALARKSTSRTVWSNDPARCREFTSYWLGHPVMDSRCGLEATFDAGYQSVVGHGFPKVEEVIGLHGVNKLVGLHHVGPGTERVAGRDTQTF